MKQRLAELDSFSRKFDGGWTHNGSCFCSKFKPRHSLLELKEFDWNSIFTPIFPFMRFRTMVKIRMKVLFHLLLLLSAAMRAIWACCRRRNVVQFDVQVEGCKHGGEDSQKS